ncbi:MAG: GNAT family N-acetyltransferase [Elusimicrobia bacterium]|nr:GNAT family N-acetyltransferase [Elusimicrobiota bacterium]
MARLSIVACGARDAKRLAPLFDAYRMFYKQRSDLASARRFLSRRLRRGESVVFLALDGTRCLGFVQLYPTFSSVSMRPLWILNDLFVVPEARRGGVGKALLRRARKFASETGKEGLFLETARTNRKAQRLYEKLGWQRDTEFYRYDIGA